MMGEKNLAFDHIFFIGIAGTGMSALAQYLKGIGKNVSGSDRYFRQGEYNTTREKLESEGIACFEQNGEGINADTRLVVVSTAIEETVPEVQKTLQMGIPIMKRSALLARIAETKKTIAVGGTSGKSTTSAMLFDILDKAGYGPSIINGAGLVSLIEKGKIGNAAVGTGEWLVIEADESDGSIIEYHPEWGLLLNIDKDHKEVETLMQVFTTFQQNSRNFIVNRSHALAATLSVNPKNDFSTGASADSGYAGNDFEQHGLQVSFKINGFPFQIQTVGRINMENALAAVAVACQIGVSYATAAQALAEYKGIYRRHQMIGKKKGILLIDDYAHNPVKCAGSIEACQPLAPKVIAWFQPHGYGPTKFLRHDFVQEIARVLRPSDEIWMSEIFYAGGTAVKDISAADLIHDLRQKGCAAYFVENRNELLRSLEQHFTNDCVLLLMGARDPGLEQFAAQVWDGL